MAPRIKFSMRKGAAVQVIGPVTDRAAYRTAQAVRGRALANIHALGRIDTGAMIRGLQVRVISKVGLVGAYQVYSSAPHTPYQEFGTRGHGPKIARFLVFQPKGSSRLVFAKRVRGVTAGHFMKRAMDATTTRDALG